MIRKSTLKLATMSTIIDLLLPEKSEILPHNVEKMIAAAEPDADIKPISATLAPKERAYRVMIVPEGPSAM